LRARFEQEKTLDRYGWQVAGGALHQPGPRLAAGRWPGPQTQFNCRNDRP
jgi:hypothetical protein